MLVQSLWSKLVGLNSNSTIHSRGRLGRVVKRVFFFNSNGASFWKMELQPGYNKQIRRRWHCLMVASKYLQVMASEGITLLKKVFQATSIVQKEKLKKIPKHGHTRPCFTRIFVLGSVVQFYKNAPAGGNIRRRFGFWILPKVRLTFVICIHQNQTKNQKSQQEPTRIFFDNFYLSKSSCCTRNKFPCCRSSNRSTCD